MICIKCNNSNIDGVSYCAYCGNLLNVSQPQPVQVPVAPIMKEKSGFSNIQKTIIIVLLLIVVAGLSFLLIFNKKDFKLQGEDSDNSRTVMIYMEGSNLESNFGISTADLAAISPEEIDVSNTNILLYTGGTKEWQNDYISADENAIFILTDDGFKKLEKYDKLNMGDSKTLSDFINYSYDNYPASRYNLIIYDHGGALDGAVYDDFTNDNLSISDFKQAMADSSFNEENKLDSILFRTCLNGTLEIASIFEPYAEYIIFSEEISYGGNTTNVLSFLNNVELGDNGAVFGSKFIDQYKVQMDEIDFFGTNGVTYSVVDLSKVSKIYDELDEFFKGIDMKGNYNDISRIRSSMYQYGSSNSQAYDTVDLLSLVENLASYSSIKPDNLKAAIEDAVVQNHTNIKSSNGISIYFPYNGADFRKKFLGVYKDLKFSDTYKQFITSFYNAQNSAGSFGFNYTRNKAEVSKDTREVSIKLTDEQLQKYSSSLYIVFERDKEHPNYYKMIYSSNEVDMTEDGTITTKIADNLIVVSDSERDFYVPLIHRNYAGDVTDIAGAIFYNQSLKINSKNRILSGEALFDYDDGKPFIASARVSSAKDERIIGQLLDLKAYNLLEMYFYEYKILDSKGNYTEEWEGSPTLIGVSGDVGELDFNKASLRDGEYYVVFYIADVNNETSTTNLIRIGD